MQDSQTCLKVTIVQSGETLVEVVIDADSALLGSGGHCDVRLGPDQLALEHLYVESKPAGVFGEVRASEPTVYVDGAPFQGGRINDGSRINIGELVVQVQVVSATLKQGSERRSQFNPTVIIGLVLLAGLVVFASHRALKQEPRIEMLEPPALFAETEVNCPETTPTAAAAAAEELMAKADGRKERAPFVPEDAVEAVNLYHQVAACLKLADWEHGAKIIRQEARVLEKRVDDALHVHNVRLWRALELKRGSDARNEIQVLRGYLKGKTGPYADWLSKTERELELQQNAAKTG